MRVRVHISVTLDHCDLDAINCDMGVGERATRRDAKLFLESQGIMGLEDLQDRHTECCGTSRHHETIDDGIDV